MQDISLKFNYFNALNMTSTGLQIDDIGLILDETTSHTLEAFVLFAQSNDFDMALKRNWDILGNR